MKAIVKTDFNFKGQKSHYVGKVRDVYSINDEYLVMVVSDRISAFDVVLPEGIPFNWGIICSNRLFAVWSISRRWGYSVSDRIMLFHRIGRCSFR